MGGNRLSLTLTMFQNADSPIRLSAITAGGSPLFVLLFFLQELVFFQKRFQILAGKAARHLCHLRSCGAPVRGPFWQRRGRGRPGWPFQRWVAESRILAVSMAAGVISCPLIMPAISCTRSSGVNFLIPEIVVSPRSSLYTLK